MVFKFVHLLIHSSSSLNILSPLLSSHLLPIIIKMQPKQANNATKRSSRTRTATKVFEEGTNQQKKTTIQRKRPQKPTPSATLAKVMKDPVVKEATASRSQTIMLDILKSLDPAVYLTHYIYQH